MSIEVKKISYIYMPKSPYERLALDDVAITIPEGKITAIAGHTGSGKSTLIQHLNGLISPSQGCVLVDGVDISGKGKEAREARRSVGMVFQYPEHQLFEETVEQDIAFGPKNYGLTSEEVQERVRFAMDFVQLDYEEYSQRSPFQLSGGQMRRVAIAGVVALRPKYLVLDEPTAGLDPKGREELMQRILKLHRQEKNTIVLVSHSMDDIARFADNVVIMNRGRVLMEGTPREVFVREDFIRQAGLEVPQITNIVKALKSGGMDIPSDIYTMDEAVEAIVRAMRGKNRAGGAERC
ncbi:MAG: energy-coupling factor transporter ATPase [Selenomonadaceae bacterium]|nr:energy-coupling factor transporter ATPase [Selenomonadaceae bacterium]